MKTGPAAAVPSQSGTRAAQAGGIEEHGVHMIGGEVHRAVGIGRDRRGAVPRAAGTRSGTAGRSGRPRRALVPAAHAVAAPRPG